MCTSHVTESCLGQSVSASSNIITHIKYLHPEAKDGADSSTRSCPLHNNLLADSVSCLLLFFCWYMFFCVCVTHSKKWKWLNLNFCFEVTHCAVIKHILNLFCIRPYCQTHSLPPHSLFSRTVLTGVKWNAATTFIPSLVTDVNQSVHEVHS